MKKKSSISPIEIMQKNQELINELYITDKFMNNKILEILIDVHLNPKVLIKEYNISKEDYNSIISEIREKYNSKNIRGKGSCIFIHLTNNYKATAGCIALREKDFLIAALNKIF